MILRKHILHDVVCKHPSNISVFCAKDTKAQKNYSRFLPYKSNVLNLLTPSLFLFRDKLFVRERFCPKAVIIVVVRFVVLRILFHSGSSEESIRNTSYFITRRSPINWVLGQDKTKSKLDISLFVFQQLVVFH